MPLTLSALRPPRRASRVACALVFVLASACAPKVPRFPGPLRVVGAEPVALPTADAVLAVARPPKAHPERNPVGDKIASAAEYYLEHRPKGFRDDCSGFVSASLARAGVEVSGSSASLWALAEDAGTTSRKKTPRPGDIAFFDNTYDRNHNGRNDDELSHVAVVVAVDADGTIHLAQGGTGKGRTALVMNLRDPDRRTDDSGKEINGYLRRQSDADPHGTRYLASQLWRGFATFDGDESGSASVADAASARDEK